MTLTHSSASFLGFINGSIISSVLSTSLQYLLYGVSSVLWTVLQYFLYCVKLSCLACVFCVHNVLWYASRDLFLKMAAIEGRVTGLCAVLDQVEDYADSMTTFAAFRVMASDLYSHATQRAFLDHLAPNTTVFDSMNDSPRCRSILDLAKPNRALVLNFGAVTCPIFTENLKLFNVLNKKFVNVADFYVVYTRESHASNEWVFKNAAHSIPQHRDIAERLHAAHSLTECYDVNKEHVVVDCMSNETSLAYGAFPMRLYVLYNRHVYYEGGYGPMGYNLAEVETVLNKFSTKQN